MKKIRITLLCALTFLITSISLNAQLIQTDNFGIFPSAGPLNVNGQFAAIGESGGTTQPVNGCDLYGFRSQIDIKNSINIGMQRQLLQIVGQPPVYNPTILWESSGNSRLLFQQRQSNVISPFPIPVSCGATYMSVGRVSGSPYILTINGSAFATNGVWQNSDLRLKNNVRSITNAIDIVSKLNGVSYDYDLTAAPEKNLAEGNNYGFIAQEVQKILPAIVQDDDEGFLSMKYDAIIPILTEAIKTQQEFIADQDLTIEEQDKKIDNLEARLAKIEQLLNATQSRKNNETTITSLATAGVTLKQNRPNPFSTSTTIEYELPETITSASLVVYDMYGKQVRSFAISSNNGTVEIDASTLSKGTYIYSIEVEGKILAREKMIIQK